MTTIPQEVRETAPRPSGQTAYHPGYPPPPSTYQPQGPPTQPAPMQQGVMPQVYGQAQYVVQYDQNGQPQAYGQPPPGAQYPAQYAPQYVPQHGPPAGPQYGTQYGNQYQPASEAVWIGVNEPAPAAQAAAGSGGFFGGGTDWEIPEDQKLTEDVDIKVRMGFVRKVYGILSCQLLVTFGMALWFNLHRAAALWLYRNTWVMIVAAVLMCVTVCTLTCVPKAARKVPLNYILLGILAVAMGAILGYTTGVVDTSAFAIAVGMTTAVTVAVSLFACQTKWDFTGCGIFAFVGIILLMIFGLVVGFVRNKTTHIVYASLGAALFSFYIIMDTQKIVGGKHRKYEFSIDDYAFAALALYLDIINLFMYILQILALTDNN